MRITIKIFLVLVLSCEPFDGQALAQQPPTTHSSIAADLSAYNINREITLTGTVQSFTPASQTAPLGAHLTLQTTGGVVDVHLGDVRLLTANHFFIAVGDSLRIIGEPVLCGTKTQFVARIVQKGAEVLAVRSPRGTPLSYMLPRNVPQAKSPAGVL